MTTKEKPGQFVAGVGSSNFFKLFESPRFPGVCPNRNPLCPTVNLCCPTVNLFCPTGNLICPTGPCSARFHRVCKIITIVCATLYKLQDPLFERYCDFCRESASVFAASI